MSTKTPVLTLIILSITLLNGCHITTGSKSAAVQVDVSSERKVAQLQKELKLANERAELERQKREFTEEQLRKLKEEKEKRDEVDKPSQGDAEEGS